MKIPKEDGLTFATLSGVKLEYPGGDFTKVDQSSDEPHVVVARKSSAPVQQVFVIHLKPQALIRYRTSLIS